MPCLKFCPLSTKYAKYFSPEIKCKFSSSSPASSPSPAVFHRGDLRVGKRHGRHAGQRGHLSKHRRARAEHRGRAQHPQPHALLRHVRLLRRVRLPRECGERPGSRRRAQTSTDVLLPPPLPQVGLPAKSGVSGAVLLVVPNVMGVMCWSPPLDRSGNSVRGIHFCQVTDPPGAVDRP